MAVIGLIGGSFSPAHAGHIEISKHAYKSLRLNEVWWIVSPLNPLKKNSELTNINNRVDFAEKLTKPDFIKVKLLENCGEKSYSINLITNLLCKFKDHKFIWLMGADNLTNFHQWYKYDEIINLINIAIFPRNKNLKLPNVFNELYFNNKVKESEINKLRYINPPAWSIIKMQKINISSTAIRNGTYSK